MEITVTQFKARCLGIIEKVQKEKCRVLISKHGRIAAELIPVEENTQTSLWARAAKTTSIRGDILETGEPWHAED